MELEERLDLQQYARHHGLTAPFRADDLARLDIDICHHESVLSALDDYNDAPQFEPTQPDGREKLDLPRSSAWFLKGVVELKGNGSSGYHGIQSPHKYKALKFELPLLHTDHDVDVGQFLRSTKTQSSLDATRFERIRLDDGADETLHWPSSYSGIARQVEQEASTEKLNIPQTSLTFLASIAELKAAGRVAERAADDDLHYARAS